MNKAMHFKEINPIQWDALLVQYDESLWYQQARNIQLIASSYQKQAIYYACYHQSVFCAAMVLYVHKKNAALPTHFFYTPFFINTSLKDFVVNQALNQMLLELKTEYNTIELKLAPKFNDIRAFTWSGFTHHLYYTLNKGLILDEKKPSENIRRQINKIAHNEAIQVKVETTNLDSIIATHLQMMLKNGMGKAELQQVKHWVNTFYQQQQLVVFGLYESTNLKGSALLTFDQQQAYLISITGGVPETQGQTALYFAIFDHFSKMGITKVDLLGANIQGVAEYKSKLGSQLAPYFILSYRKQFLFYQLKLMLKKRLKRQ
jgi:hypothetical protein